MTNEKIAKTVGEFAFLTGLGNAPQWDSSFMAWIEEIGFSELPEGLRVAYVQGYKEARQSRIDFIEEVSQSIRLS